MSKENLSNKSVKILKSFALDRWYIYMRPTTSAFAKPDGKDEDVYWVVTVQLRAFPPHEFREEGRDLDVLIRNLGKRVPRRSELAAYNAIYNDNGPLGPTAPSYAWQQGLLNALNAKKVDLPADHSVNMKLERGWGTKDTTGGATPDRKTLAKLIPPPLPI